MLGLGVLLAPIDERHDGHKERETGKGNEPIPIRGPWCHCGGISRFMSVSAMSHVPVPTNVQMANTVPTNTIAVSRPVTICPINKMDTTNSALLPQISAKYRRCDSLSVI